jgi:heptosyltransferase-1
LRTQSKFRLLVVRLGAMGDILHALPAVTALRLAHPTWEIGWVVEPRWRGLLAAPATDQGSSATQARGEPAFRRGEQMPIVDRLHFAPTRDWAKQPMHPKTATSIGHLRNELLAVGYDAVLDLQGSIRSAAIARMAKIGRVIGEDHPRETPARWLFTERVATHGAHVIEQDIELAAAVAGDELAFTRAQLPVDPAADAWCDELLASSGTRPVALINPGAGWGAKRWPVERYAKVARGLMERGFRILVNAGPSEEPMADAIVKETSGAAIPLATSLDQLIAISRRIALCVAGDTGPLHLACALGKPVVGIYGPTDPSRNGPFGTEFRVLRSPKSKRDHTRREEPEAAMLSITPEDVLQAAAELVKAEPLRFEDDSAEAEA